MESVKNKRYIILGKEYLGYADISAETLLEDGSVFKFLSQEEIDKKGLRFSDKKEETYMWDNALVALKRELIDNNPYTDIGLNTAYRVGVEDFLSESEKERLLPSRFQIGDLVSIKFEPNLIINMAEIIKVHFTRSKVLYDLEVRIPIRETIDNPEGYSTTRFYNIDSAIVS